MTHPPFEEQTSHRYQEKHYCPVRIGQLFNRKYRILAKLGYGAHSTVWLVRNEMTHGYCSLKVSIRVDADTADSPVQNEVKVLRHLAACSQAHGGASVARLAEEIFEFDGHTCIVMKAQACSLWHSQHMFPELRLPKEVVMATAMRLLACINWLQLECGVVHADICPQNVLTKADDDTIFKRAENEELESRDSLSPTEIHTQSYPVYPSRGLPSSLSEALGNSILTDFGSARFGTTRGWWMRDTYRAPEILMGLPWDYQVDVWSIGVMVLELLEGKPLFDPIDRHHNQYVLPLALAQYIGYMGPPPLWMIQNSDDPFIATYFNEQGEWIAEPPIRIMRFEDFVTVIPPGDEKSLFLNFIQKIFTWDPTTRALSSDLFEDEWLTKPFKDMGIL